MDSVFLTHVILYAIGGLAALGAVLTVAAFWSMGRSAYRKE